MKSIAIIVESLRKYLQEDFYIDQVQTLVQNKNKVILKKIFKLLTFDDNNLNFEVINFFYEIKYYDELAVILGAGNLKLSKLLINTLLKKSDGITVIKKIVMPSLITCAYRIQLDRERTFQELKNIWRSLRNSNSNEIVNTAKLAYKRFVEDENLNEIIKNVIVNAFKKVFR